MERLEKFEKFEKYENFKNCFNVLKSYNPDFIINDEIYRMGVISQFNLTFELSWKLLQALLRAEGVAAAASGSPREILKLGYKYGMINDENAWLDMLKDRNINIHVYNEDIAEDIVKNITETYIPVLSDFCEDTKKRLESL